MLLCFEALINAVPVPMLMTMASSFSLRARPPTPMALNSLILQVYRGICRPLCEKNRHRRFDVLDVELVYLRNLRTRRGGDGVLGPNLHGEQTLSLEPHDLRY